jgi:hypothetical protein
MPGQRRGTGIAMTEEERETFLRAAQPVCRVATVGPGRTPAHQRTLVRLGRNRIVAQLPDKKPTPG